MNKTYHELCDEIAQLREQLEDAQASINLARLTTRQALAKAEVLERERNALLAGQQKPIWVGYDLAERDALLAGQQKPIWVGYDLAEGDAV